MDIREATTYYNNPAKIGAATPETCREVVVTLGIMYKVGDDHHTSPTANDHYEGKHNLTPYQTCFECCYAQGQPAVDKWIERMEDQRAYLQRQDKMHAEGYVEIDLGMDLEVFAEGDELSDTQNEIDHLAERYNFTCPSSGMGFGFRDMQLESEIDNPDTDKLVAQIGALLEGKGKSYVSVARYTKDMIEEANEAARREDAELAEVHDEKS